MGQNNTTGRLCYITRNYQESLSAGSKAKQDYEDIIVSLGGINLGLKRTHFHNKVVTFILNLAGVIKCCFSLHKGDKLVLQYPIKKYFTLLCRAAKWRGASTIALIHDLGSFRRKRLTVEQEMARLSHADHIIATNSTMGQWLTKQGLQKTIVSLGLHDYLSSSQIPQPDTPRQSGPWRIAYAGTLRSRKSSFLKQLADMDKNYQLHLFGKEDDHDPIPNKPNVVKHGFVDSNHFVTECGCDFGLVWDGDSLDSCSGDFGEYLRYNTPHKVSLYLLAGMPLLVWTQAAIASLIQELGIGIIINNLHEIDGALQALTPQQLADLRQNAFRVANDISTGKFLTRALQQLT